MPGMDLLAWVCDTCQAVLNSNMPHKGLSDSTCHGPVKLQRFEATGEIGVGEITAVRVVPESWPR